MKSLLVLSFSPPSKMKVALLFAGVMVFASEAQSGEVEVELALCADHGAPLQRQVEACTKLIAASSDRRVLFRAYANRAKAYYYMGRGDLAFPDYSQAVLAEPENPLGYRLRGGAHLAYGQFEDAIEDLSVVLSKYPDDVHVLSQRASAYHRSKNLNAAIADYGSILKLRPNDAESYFIRGGLYAETKNWDRARIDFNRAIELEPNYAQDFAAGCFKHDPIYPFVKRGGLFNWPDCER